MSARVVFSPAARMRSRLVEHLAAQQRAKGIVPCPQAVDLADRVSIVKELLPGPAPEPGARDYVRAGLALVPIPRGRKGPTRKGWNLRANAIRDEAAAARLDGGNVGVAHAWCDPTPTCAIDIDALDLARPWLRGQGIEIDELLDDPHAVRIESGRPGRAKLLYRLPHALLTLKPEGSGIELRCASANGLTVQDVLPPSIHPETQQPYRWIGDWRAIPAIPQALLGLWQKLTGEAPAKPKETSEPAGSPGHEPIGWPLARRQIEDDLPHISADEYDVWVSIGMAIFHECNGLPEGLAMWDRWSETSPKYKPGACSTKWPTFATGRDDKANWAAVHRKVEEARGTASSELDDEPWPEPIDLWGTVVAPDVRRDDLPPVIADYAFEVGASLGVDPGSVACAAMTVLAAAISDSTRVQVKSNDPEWVESPRLWVALVGDPSTKKTPVMHRVTKVAWRINARLNEANEAAVARWRDECRTAKKDKRPEPGKPKLLRFITDDTTMEALSDVLAVNPHGVLQSRDELSDWFAAINRYNASASAGPWLQLYNGGPRSFDRVLRGHVFVENWSACILGGIQPGALERVAERLPNDGLLQRFMPVFCSRRDETERDLDIAKVEAFERLVEDTHAVRDESPGEPLRLTPEAETVRRALFKRIDGVRTALSGADVRLGAHLGKWEGLAARLMVVFHVAELPLREPSVARLLAHVAPAPLPAIEAATVERVGRFMFEYLLAHLVAFYESVLGADSRGTVRDDCAKVADHILAKGWARIGSHQIGQSVKRWRYRDDRERGDVFACLAGLGWIRKQGRAWAVNPRVHGAFAARTAVAREGFAALAAVMKRAKL